VARAFGALTRSVRAGVRRATRASSSFGTHSNQRRAGRSCCGPRSCSGPRGSDRRSRGSRAATNPSSAWRAWRNTLAGRSGGRSDSFRNRALRRTRYVPSPAPTRRDAHDRAAGHRFGPAVQGASMARDRVLPGVSRAPRSGRVARHTRTAVVARAQTISSCPRRRGSPAPLARGGCPRPRRSRAGAPR